MSVTIQVEPFDVARETMRLQGENQAIGAIVTFIGLVRDINEGEAVSELTLEHYPGMAEKEIARTISEAQSRWALEAVRVVHRVGKLKPLDPIVFVAVASQHRADAFCACEYIMDYLKTRASIWKKEQTTSGARWVEARQSDQISLQKWHESSPE